MMLLATVLAASAVLSAEAAPQAGNATIELFLLPHTHADVGWCGRAFSLRAVHRRLNAQCALS